MKRFKASHLAKGMTKSLQKNKSFDFHSTKWFLKQRSLAQFCFKGLSFHLESQIPFKSQPCPKGERVASDLLNKTIAKRFYLHPLKKISKTKMNLQVSKKGLGLRRP